MAFVGRGDGHQGIAGDSVPFRAMSALSPDGPMHAVRGSDCHRLGEYLRKLQSQYEQKPVP